jgi:hypothetical protein
VSLATVIKRQQIQILEERHFGDTHYKPGGAGAKKMEYIHLNPVKVG